MFKSDQVDDGYDNEEALNSPFSRVYLCQESEHIINCAMGVKHPIDIEAFKEAFSNSMMIKHPRFCSLIVRNPNGREYWKRTHVNIDNHFILHHHHPITTTEKTGPHLDEVDDEEEAAVNAFLADISVSSPLNEDKPLWEVHVLVGLKCVVLRVHHVLGDGVSLMSMLSSCFGQKRGIQSSVNGDHNVKDHTHAKRKWKGGGILGLMESMWYTSVFGLRLLGRVLWVKDEKSMLSGGDGVELWPRKVATAKFKIEDFKSIRKAIPNVTVNDVLLGVISYGLAKYVNVNSSQALQQSLQVTAALVVNLRKNHSLQEKTSTLLMRAGSSYEFSSWGNKTSVILIPIYCCNGLQPLDHVRAMKNIMDKKKCSYEANLLSTSLKILNTYMGPKVGNWSCYKVLCNTTLLISNIMGPSEEIAIADNPVTYIKLSISSQPHALTMHMVSYAGKANLQVMVAKDVIPDPAFLVKCFHDSIAEMKTSIQN